MPLTDAFKNVLYQVDIHPARLKLSSQMQIVDKKHHLYSRMSTPCIIDTFAYKCTFTTLNGNGRFGPTNYSILQRKT